MKKGFIKKWCKTNYLLVISFFIVLFFLLLQHYWMLGWDFSAYVINARFFFGKGDYAEVLRAPLISVLLGLTIIFGKLGEYLYVLIATTLFFIANVLLSDFLYKKYFHRYTYNKVFFQFLFYIFSFTPFVIYSGLLEGTELLGLALFELFLVFWLKDSISGYLLGLAVLTRYNFLAFVPLLFINRDYKKILKNIFSFILVLIPWFIYNRIKWGNFFTSIIDSYSQNILSRIHLMRPFNFIDLAYSINILIPFFVIGLIFVLFILITKKESFKDYKFHLLFLFILVVVLWDYNRTPLKILRYLFNISLPVAYFSIIGFFQVFKQKFHFNKKLIFIVLLIWLLLGGILCFKFYSSRIYDEMYEKAGKAIISHNLTSCYVASNHWVAVNYYTGNVYTLWRKPSEIIENNGLVLVFPNYPTLDDSFTLDELKGLPVIANGGSYILFGKENLSSSNCWKRFAYSDPSINNPCFIVSSKFGSLNNTFDNICMKFNKN